MLTRDAARLRWKRDNIPGFREKENAATRAWRLRVRAENLEADRARRRRLAGLPEALHPCPAFCECCGQPPRGVRPLMLDHDHTDGRFRGWLCLQCNIALARLGDNLEGIMRMVAYLQRSTQ